MQEENNFSDLNPLIIDLANRSKKAGIIETDLFTKYDVKRGLRDLNGRGVLAGLTNISDVRANKIVNGEQVPLPGELFYRGYNVRDLVSGIKNDDMAEIRTGVSEGDVVIWNDSAEITDGMSVKLD